MKKTILILGIGVMVCLFTPHGTPACWAKVEEPTAQKTLQENEFTGDHKICRVCGMYIKRFKRTAAYIDFTNGKSYAYCGVSCAIRTLNEKGGFDAAKSAYVTAWDSQEKVEMQKATYVIGSRLIPDMLPNIIAFGSKEAAEAFIKEKGGKIESLGALLAGTSYRGLTMPFRIPAAAVPSKGVFNWASGFAVKKMHGLKHGNNHITNTDGLSRRMKIPTSMITYMFPQGFGYGITDNIFGSVSYPYIVKQMKTRGYTMTNTVPRRRIDNSNGFQRSGFGDLSLGARWRLWHDMEFDKHLGMLGAVSVPTGHFDKNIRDKPTLQLGTGAFGFTTGLLYSQHIGKFWVHAAGTYQWNLENHSGYDYGDNIKYGLAIHYLPTIKDLFGFELDTETALRNKDHRVKVSCTGRTTLNYNFIYQRQVLLCFGGNLNASGLIGFTAYDHVKDYQLGESFHAAANIQWTRKF